MAMIEASIYFFTSTQIQDSIFREFVLKINERIHLNDK